jgi:alkyl hydroperoxide reductase subunit F
MATYDLIIIGGGPAGVAAGVYAGRKKIKTLILTDNFGGQSTTSTDIQNWIGTKSVSGETLGQQLKDHLFTYTSDTFVIKEQAKVIKVESEGKNFAIATDGGERYQARAVLVASGAVRRRLNVPGAKEFEQKGITYCASCDGPVFADKDVAVIGGGNAAFETAMQLAAYCRSVTMIEFQPNFRADKITIDKVLVNPKIKGITNAETIEFKGEKFLKFLIYKNRATGATTELPVEGVFVEIGFIPATNFVRGLVELTDIGAIKVDHRTERTNLTGIWAAGDCTDVLYHQNNIAVGDAIKALEDIYFYLNTQ